ncbi:amino acid permease [Acidianus sulfidivorans JP7]|uniref:APC family permease n=1 Tax=Acidianus sulfidivorans JP7 TaxID=619593 RepID=A0A2U9IN99_9CREN|nr:APC family permease [Acidianus sulfidivorans]AWR97490.1 amino acid permease [Acidianus sulfidivorans JP7]
MVENTKATNEEIKNEKKLSFGELFFMSFGGQAPFISLLTFGTIMIALVGKLGALAMLVATLVVLFNGLTVYFLSKRFNRGGGYYVYALYGLSNNLGLETGWNYLLYALAYGGTLLAGGAYVLYSIIGINQTILAFIVSSFASILVILGVNVSAKYATIMSIIEMSAIVILSLVFLHESGFKFYNPFKLDITPTFLEAVVFGLGIPTGYGSIAPLAKEAKDKLAIGKAAIAVLLVGGLLSTLFFYSLGSINFTGNLVEYLLSRFGIISLVGISFIALNDGTLGGMAYILANSRTFKAMVEDSVFPSIFNKEYKGKPLASEIFIAIIFISVLTLMAHYFGLYNTFLTLGAVAGLSNLFIHSSANFSLLRISHKRSRKHIAELATAIIGLIISIFVLIYSLPSIQAYIQDIFFGWIIFGFLYAEALNIIKEDIKMEKEENK